MEETDEESRLLSILGVTAANPEDIERDVIAAVSFFVLPHRLSFLNLVWQKKSFVFSSQPLSCFLCRRKNEGRLKNTTEERKKNKPREGKKAFKRKYYMKTRRRRSMVMVMKVKVKIIVKELSFGIVSLHLIRKYRL